MTRLYYKLLNRLLFNRPRYGNRLRPLFRPLRRLIPNPAVRWQNGMRLRPVVDHKFWVSRCAKGVHEPSLDLLLSHCLRPGDTVLDAGAQIGITVVMEAQRVAPDGQVHAFEPNAENFALLHDCLKTNGVTNVVCNAVALGEKPGSAVFAVEAFSGFIQRADAREDGVEVPVTTLDQYVKDHAIARVDFVKIDVDGPDLSVLLGARELAARAQAPFFSIECSRYWQRFGAEVGDAFRFFADNGYAVAVARLNETEVTWLRDPAELPAGWGTEKTKAINLYAFKPGQHDHIAAALGLSGPWPTAAMPADESRGP